MGVFRECLELDAKNVYAENGMGSAYERMSRLDEAAAAYRNIIAWQSAKTASGPHALLESRPRPPEAEQTPGGR